VSYGVYLYHWPIYLFVDAARTGLVGLPLLVLRVSLTIGLAVLSFRHIEEPVRTGAWAPFRRLAALPVTVGATLLAVLVATAGAGAPPSSRLSASALAAQVAAGSAALASPPPPVDDIAALEAAKRVRPLPGSHRPRPAPAAPVRPRYTGPVTVLFLGDSVSESLSAPLPSTPQLRIITGGIIGCGITTDSPFRYFGAQRTLQPQCWDWMAQWRAKVRAYSPNVVAILVGRWELMDRLHNGQWMHVGEPAYDAYLTAQLRAAVGVASSGGAHVVLLTAPYDLRGERPDGGRWPEDDPSRVDAWNALVRQVAAGSGGVATVVDLAGRLDPVPGHFVNVVAGIPSRYDGVHFSPAIVRWLAPWLLPQLQSAAVAVGH
jgi:hypothetical protein